MLCSPEYCNIPVNVAMFIGSNCRFGNATCNLKILGSPLIMACTPKNKTIPIPIRERIVALWAQGESFKSISTKVGISNRTVSNIITNIAEREHLLALQSGGKGRQIANPNVVEFIEYKKNS